jgi:ribosomal protein S18 acetylase RimI-like enzyme
VAVPAIRKLGPGDESVSDAACRAFGSEGDFDAALFLRRPEATLLVSEVDGEVAGWVYGQELAHPDAELTMLLYALDVVEAHHRQGHGRALVDAFVADARSRGCTEVWVLTEQDNDAALATYAAAGGAREAETSVMFVWPLDS